MTASLAAQYAHLLDAINAHVDTMPHNCQIYDVERMEYYTRPELCDRCHLERLLGSEPKP